MKAAMLCLLLVAVGCSAETRQEVKDLAKFALEEKRKIALACMRDASCRAFVLEEAKKVVK